MGRVQRHIRCTRLEDGQHADHHLRRTFHAKPHQHIRPDTTAEKGVTQLIGSVVQIPIAKLAVLIDDRDRFRRACDLSLEQMMNALAQRVVDLRSVPINKDLPSLGNSQQGQLPYGSVRISDHTVQQNLKMARHPLDGRGIEQITAVFKCA